MKFKPREELNLSPGMLLTPVWQSGGEEKRIFLLLKPEFRRYREGTMRAGWMTLCGEEIAFCLEDFLLEGCREVELK